MYYTCVFFTHALQACPSGCTCRCVIQLQTSALLILIKFQSGLARLRGFKLDALSHISVVEVTYRSSSDNMLKTSLDLLLVNTDSLIFNNTIRKMFAS
jgi:hypothetical protein